MTMKKVKKTRAIVRHRKAETAELMFRLEQKDKEFCECGTLLCDGEFCGSSLRQEEAARIHFEQCEEIRKNGY